jgi:hypothetical protein
MKNEKSNGLFAVLIAVLFNCMSGAFFGTLLGATPEAGAVAMNGIGLIPQVVQWIDPSVQIVKGLFLTGVYKEIWLGRVVDQLTKQADDTWLGKIRDDSNLVDNDVIHINKILDRPNVLLNHNGSIPKSPMGDEDIPISLERWDTENTNVTDAELDTISYPKMDKVTENHRIALHNFKMDRSAFNCAPSANATNTPIIAGLGSSATIEDYFKAAKESCDAMELSEEGRCMILSSAHLNEVFGLSNKFHDIFYSMQQGKITPMLYGFEIFTSMRNPLYNTTTNAKASFGTVATSVHKKGSLFFHKDSIFKAIGTTKIYMSRSDQNPTDRETLFGLRQRGIVRPVMEDFGYGAIVK